MPLHLFVHLCLLVHICTRTRAQPCTHAATAVNPGPRHQGLGLGAHSSHSGMLAMFLHSWVSLSSSVEWELSFLVQRLNEWKYLNRETGPQHTQGARVSYHHSPLPVILLGRPTDLPGESGFQSSPSLGLPSAACYLALPNHRSGSREAQLFRRLNRPLPKEDVPKQHRESLCFRWPEPLWGDLSTSDVLKVSRGRGPPRRLVQATAGGESSAPGAVPDSGPRSSRPHA